MTWQDLVFSLGTVAFQIALIPMLRAQEKPPLSASVPTALVLYLFAATYATLGYWFTVVFETIGASLWAVLAIQRGRR